MKTRHAAALALVGWYLMVPPQLVSPGHETANVDAAVPLNKWTVWQAFDTAIECESQLETLKEGALQRTQTGQSREFMQKLLDNQFFRGQCIATDDPRLKEK
jgi:hypothetical protein